MAKIIFTTGPLGEAEIHLVDKDIVIGRTADADLYLDDPGVSTSHAKLHQSRDDWHLIDLGCSNGTFVNDEAVTSVKLKHGDEVFIG